MADVNSWPVALAVAQCVTVTDRRHRLLTAASASARDDDDNDDDDDRGDRQADRRTDGRTDRHVATDSRPPSRVYMQLTYSPHVPICRTATQPRRKDDFTPTTVVVSNVYKTTVVYLGR